MEAQGLAVLGSDHTKYRSTELDMSTDVGSGQGESNLGQKAAIPQDFPKPLHRSSLPHLGSILFICGLVSLT